MIANLSDEETTRLEAFLASPRIAVLASLKGSGSPQISPIWYRYSEGRVTMSTVSETVKSRNIVRGGRASVCVYSEPGAFEYASPSGAVTVIDDDSLWTETCAIVDRYELPVLRRRRAVAQHQNKGRDGHRTIVLKTGRAP